MSLVYLAGPITGCTFTGCTDWREYCKERLLPITGISPMRGKDNLAGLSVHIKDHYDTILSNKRAILTRDFWDTTRSDVVLVNLLGATKVSIGTVMKIAWAHATRKPIVLVMEKAGNLHEHSMLTEVCGFRVETLDDAIKTIKSLIG